MPDATFDAKPGVDGSVGDDARPDTDAAPEAAKDVTADQQQDVSVDQAEDVTSDDAADVSSDQVLSDSPEEVSPDTSLPDAPPDVQEAALPDVQGDVPCNPPLELCSGECVDTETSTQHCGGCGSKCPTPFNSLATCSSGSCSFDCLGDFANCNSQSADGCETNTSSSIQHCGACSFPCAFTNATPTCVSSKCVMGACNAGFGDCDGNPATGCEVDTKTNSLHCGGCNKPCTVPANATAVCSSSTCSFVCKTGWRNCDANAANGCEATAAAKSYRDEVMADTPIAYWRLGDAAGTTVADSSGHALDLAVHPPVTFGQTGALFCDPDKAMKFVNADGGWLGHERTTALEPTAAMSFELWMLQTGAPSNYEKPLWYGDASVVPWGSWGLQRDATSPGKFAFLVATNGSTNWLTTLAIKQKDTWYHVVATYDGTAQKVYVNGVLDVQNPATGAISYPGDAYGVAVGACYGQCSVFTGSIDEVAIYSKALTSDRIAAHYAAGKQ